MTLPSSPRLAVVALTLLLGLAGPALVACSNNGANPQIGNTRLSDPGTTLPGNESGPGARTATGGVSGTRGKSPSPVQSPPGRCTAASSAAVRELQGHLSGSAGTLGSARSLPTSAAEQDGTGWPTTIVAARLTALPGSPIGVWALADTNAPARVLALNSTAARYTTGQATVSTALRSQLTSGAEAANVQLCVRQGL